MQKSNKGVIVVICVTIVLLLIIGLCYTYFMNNLRKRDNEDIKTIIDTSTIVGVEYRSNSNLGSNNISIDNANPGKYGFVEFTLTGTTKNAKANSYYQIVWNIDQNEFNYLNPDNGEVCDDDSCEAQVYYAIYSGKVDIQTTPFTDPGGATYDVFKEATDGILVEYNSQTVKNDITNKTGEIILDVGKITATKDVPFSKTYTLVVWFEETGHNQNNNQGKNLTGKIDVNIRDRKFK